MSVFNDPRLYCAALERHGYIRLGGGVYSNVYVKANRQGSYHDTQRVIKVGKRDDAWPAYVEWAIINGYTGTFAPKVYSMRFYGSFYVAVMERLVCTMNELAAENRHVHSPYHDTMMIARYHGGYRYGEKPTQDHEDLKAFMEACDKAALCTDLHGGNFMLRHDGQIVLTDPCAYYHGPKPGDIQ